MTQLWLTAPCVATLDSMVQQWIGLHVRSRVSESQAVGPNQILDCILHCMTMFNIMARCPLMEVTEKVRSIPCWQSCWYWRRRLGLDQILFEQLHIFCSSLSSVLSLLSPPSFIFSDEKSRWRRRRGGRPSQAAAAAGVVKTTPFLDFFQFFLFLSSFLFHF